MGRAVAVIGMGRPLALAAGIIAYLLGVAMASASVAVDPGIALLGLLIMVLAVLMAHYANEFADLDTDTLTRRTPFSGGSGVLPSGIVPPRWALYAALICLVATSLLTTASILFGPLEPVVGLLVALGLLGGWFYSMPPFRLERTWAGEMDNSLLGGFLMPLLAFSCLTGGITPDSVLWCFPAFLAVFANLIAVHWSDRMADEMVGKRSLTVALGCKAFQVHWILVVLTYLSLLALVGSLPWQVVLTGMLALPLGVSSILLFERFQGLSSIHMGPLMIMMSFGWWMA
ncbi:MAG: prenyltransferase [Thermoplasmatota archaeon]